MFHRVVNQIFDYLGDNNVGPVDAVQINGSYIAIIHKAKRNTSGWLQSTSSYIVPEGKKVICILALPDSAIQGDSVYRKARLYDSTNNVEVVLPTQFSRSGFISALSDTSILPQPEAIAGAILSVGLFNPDSNARWMGAIVILKEVDV